MYMNKKEPKGSFLIAFVNYAIEKVIENNSCAVYNTDIDQKRREKMVNIKVDFSKNIGKIKPMHGVGQPPMKGLSLEHFEYLREAAIPFSRLHDVAIPYGGFRFVDIPNIFRDFDADVNDAASYDFAFTDWLIKSLYEFGCAPVFRLGVSIENFIEIRSYRTDPPKDYEKWAAVCEHIIRHYNEGWADGFCYGIEYWEIWNEPEFHPAKEKNQMWTGSADDYYRLYSVTAKHLKKCFGDSIKIGGYGSCGFTQALNFPEKYRLDCEKRDYPFENVQYAIDFFYGFFDHLKKTGTPIDFFSWHSYLSVKDVEIMADFARRELDSLGFEKTEIHLNEWNNAAWVKGSKGTSFASAAAAAMMCAMQKKPINVCCYYDAELSISDYAGLFNPLTLKPFCTYYAFKAFGELYKLENEVECMSDNKDIYALAAENGDKKAVFVVNVSGNDAVIKTELSKNFDIYLINEQNMMEKAPLCSENFILGDNTAVLLKNYD